MSTGNYTHRMFAFVVAALFTSNVGVQAKSCPPASTVPMTFNGEAKCTDGRIFLTEEVGNQAGSAYTTSVFTDTTNFPFEAYFEYNIEDTGDGGQADGLAFVIHSDPAALNFLSSAVGGGLGLYNGDPASGPGGIANALIVELDTFVNAGRSAPFSEMAYARAIDVITTDSNGRATRIHEQDVSITSAWSNRGKFWISYSVRRIGVLDIYFGGEYTDPRPENPLISISVDLSSVLSGGAEPTNQVYCGFSASTGGEYDLHEIVAFSGCAEAPACPCWEFDALNDVTIDNVLKSFSCGSPDGGLRLPAIALANGAGGFIADPLGGPSGSTSTRCGTWIYDESYDGRPDYLNVSEEESKICANQIRARCDDVGCFTFGCGPSRPPPFP